MRALLLEEDRLYLAEREMPEPGAGEVLVRNLACGICGSDLHLRRHLGELRRAAAEMGAVPEALTGAVALGHEYVGEIVRAGPGVTATTGARVCSPPFLLREAGVVPLGASPLAPGGFGDYMLLSASLLVAVPDTLDTELAALTEPAGIAVHAVAKAAMPENAVPLVIGCGPIGLAMIGVLAAGGVSPIIASDLQPARGAHARAMGAETVTHGKGENGTAAAARLAPGRPLVVFDCTGARGVLRRIMLDVPAGTRIVVVGIAPGEDSFPAVVAIAKELSVQFVIHSTPAEFAAAMGIIAAAPDRWRSMIGARISLDDAEAAFDAMESGASHGKTLVLHGAIAS